MRRPRHRFAPSLEFLEDRSVPSTFTVANIRLDFQASPEFYANG